MHKWAAASRNRAFYKTFLFLFTIPLCRAVLVNRTIDSNKGDPWTGFNPIYQPRGPWADQTCSGCYIQPDIAKAFDGTWMAATYHPELQNVNVTLRFTGVAVWVFFILSNANDHGTGTTTNTQVNITLDGQYAGNYSHDPDLSTHDLIYNATIFSTSGLANTSHEIVIATNDYPLSTFLNFDWAIYTIDDGASASQTISSSTGAPLTTSSFATDDSTSSSTSTPAPQNSSPKIAVIVGSTVGGLAVIALVVLIFLFRRRRRAPPVQNQNGKTEGILDIDVPPRQPLYGKAQIHRRDPSDPSTSSYTYFPPSSSSTRSPVPEHSPEQARAARLREARQRELDERIQSAQRQMDNLKSVRNFRSASEIGVPPTPSSSRSTPEMASLRNELQQLRNQIGTLQAQRGSDWAQGLSNEPLQPPAYTRH